LRGVKTNGGYLKHESERQSLIDSFEKKSKYAYSKALALDAHNVETLLAKVSHSDGRYSNREAEEASKQYEHIAAIYPDNAEALFYYGMTQSHYYQNNRTLVEKTLESALKMDPFNVFMVRNLLEYYRYIGDQNEVTRVSNLLAQIIPETAEDRRLARISDNGKASRARFSFVKTADLAYVQEYKRIMLERRAKEDSKLHFDWLERNYCSFKNDGNCLIKLAEKNIKFQSLIRLEVSDYFDVQRSALAVYWNRGDIQNSKIIAQRIKELLVLPVVQEMAVRSPYLIRDLAIALFVLGEKEKSSYYLDKLLDENGVFYGLDFAISVMQWTDLERAVNLALKLKQDEPTHPGLDWKAAYQINERPLITHPKIQAYYAKQGKWLTYLSTYVPEYAKYKKPL
jgi:hypothetical protein